MKIHLVFQEDTEYDHRTQTHKLLPPLGFARVYDPTKKNWDSLKKTQFDWAYRWGWEERNGLVVMTEYVKDARGQYLYPRQELKITAPLQPMIVDNVAQTGFRILRSVSRYSTDNKLWRILDPRGFQLEIGTDNMEDILIEGEIHKGEILGSYIWEVANNRKPKLIPA